MQCAGKAQASHGPLLPLDVASVASVVRYGVSANELNMTARGYAVTYKELYNAMDAWCGRRHSARVDDGLLDCRVSLHACACA